MSEGSPNFRSSLRRVLREEGGEDHPSLDALEAFHWGDLPADQADRVRTHLSTCVRCLDLLAKLDEMEDADADAELEVPPGELERSLARVRERLGAEATDGIEPSHAAPLPPPPASRTRFFPRWSTAPGPYFLAAASLLAGIGLSFWLASRLDLERQRLPELESRLASATARTTAAEEKLKEARDQARSLEQQAIALRREREALLAPQANTPIVDLRASGERGEGERNVTEVGLAPEMKFLTLVIEGPGPEIYPAYRARLLDRQGKQILTVDGLRRTAYRSFVITLARNSLPAEEVLVVLEGKQGGKWTAMADYRLRVRR